MKSPTTKFVFAVVLATAVVLSLSANLPLLQVGYADEETPSVSSESVSSESVLPGNVTTDTESSPSVTDPEITSSETESTPETDPAGETGTTVAETPDSQITEIEPAPEVIEEGTPPLETETDSSAPAETSTPADSIPSTETETQSASTADSPSGPALTTDRADYHPGGIATIFGSFFQSLQDVLLNISGEGTEEVAPSEEAAAVTADTEGSFSYEYTLEDVYRPLYTVVASTLSGERLAEASFTDSAPDLIAKKRNDVDGTAAVNGAFTWTIRVKNVGTATATFDKNEKILKDEMPSADVSTYDPPDVTTSGTGGTGSIECEQEGNKNRDLTCRVSNNEEDTITIPVDAFIDVSIGVHPTATGTLTNPRDDKTCKVDPGGKVAELANNNNDCNTDSVGIVSTGTLVVKKVVINDNGGNFNPDNFSFQINGGETQPFEADGKNSLTVDPGTYTVTEPEVPGYATSYDNCDDVEVTAAGSATCTITNDDIQPRLTVTKEVANDNGGTRVIEDFPLFVGETQVTSGEENGFNVGLYTVSETADPGYAVTIGGDCDAEGGIVLELGDVKSCTITNDDIAPTITLIKEVINNDEGRAGENDFGLTIGDTPVDSGQTLEVIANTPIAINENGLEGYNFVGITGDAKCPSALGDTATLDLDEHITCTITNDDQPVEQPPELGLISGFKFNDLDGNGFWDDGEPGLEGWTVVLNGELNGEIETITGADGSYSFEDLADGFYDVCEILQDDWQQTFPTVNEANIVCESENGETWGYKAFVEGDDQAGFDFGNQQLTPTSTIFGYKWNDLDVDAFWDEGESSLSGWVINLFNNGDELLARTETDDNGRFTFPVTEPGNYKLSEDAQENWERTNPTDSFFDIFVEAIDGSEIWWDVNRNNLDFGNTYFIDFLGGHFAATSGNGESTPSAIVLGDTTLNIGGNGTASSVVLEDGTVITRSDGGDINLGELTGGVVSTDDLSGLGEGIVADGALRWGLTDLGLNFDPPITVSVFVGVDLNGQTLDILRSLDGEGGWTNDGIGPPTTCVVADGLCTFTATKASVYAATHETEGGDGGGGGGGGGSGAAAEEAGITAEIPTTTETPGITIEATPAGGVEEGGTPPAVTPAAAEEQPTTPPALATTPGLPQPLPPLLATMLNALMLGTENTFVGMLVGAALGALVAYLIYLLTKKLRKG